jgi:polysaccharide export outer membrane protein
MSATRRLIPVVVLSSPVFLFLLAGCPHPYRPYNYASEPDPRKQEFVIGPSDVLRVTVWKNPDLSGEAVVRPDGTITMPLIGDIHAAGRTSAEVRAEITQRLAAYVKDEAAVVTVAVTAINSYRFTVSGNVERPGTYNSTHYVTVSEALALAGGPNRFADPDETVVIRTDEKHTSRRIPVNLSDLLAGKHPEQNVPLLPGDVVYVP